MFNKKTWKDTIAEYPNRRTLTDAVTGATQTVNVTREVGTISQEGDAWSSANMNDLENRIENAFNGLLTATISAADTEVVFESASITTNSVIEPFFWVEDGSEIEPISYATIKVENGKVTMTFDSIESSLMVGIRVS